MHCEAGNDRTLRRIFALLVSLAGHAEAAAGRCFAVRFLVLLVLRRAEAVARDYVADAMGVDGLWFDDGMEATSSPQDAALLAERFRLLAEELGRLLAPALRFGAPLPRRVAVPSRALPRTVSRASHYIRARDARRHHATGPPARPDAVRPPCTATREKPR